MATTSIEISDQEKQARDLQVKLKFYSTRQKALATAIEENQENFEQTERKLHQLANPPESTT